MNYPNYFTPEEHLAEGKKRLDIRDVVVLCGSMRNADAMTEVAIAESVAGALVLKPDCNMKIAHPLWADPVEAEALKVRLDDQHRQKIRLADRVIVVNPGSYIGSSTVREVAYARQLGKPMRWLELHNFWSQVHMLEADDCWEWQGTRLPAGYGRFQKDKQKSYAHRFVYAARFGALEPSEVVLHACDNPPCVNPAHLSTGTQADNLSDMRRKGRGKHQIHHGSSNANAKLSDEQVAEIRARYAAGGATYRSLAADYGVHFSRIGHIIRGDGWHGDSRATTAEIAYARELGKPVQFTHPEVDPGEPDGDPATAQPACPAR